MPPLSDKPTIPKKPRHP